MKYTDLQVWQKSMFFVEKIYEQTKQFPDTERFGLIFQIQRAVVSIPSNIAEGHGRKLTNVYLNHLSIAMGSLMEVETQLRIANRLNYLNLEVLDKLLNLASEIGKMLNGLMKTLKNNYVQKTES